MILEKSGGQKAISPQLCPTWHKWQDVRKPTQETAAKRAEAFLGDLQSTS